GSLVFTGGEHDPDTIATLRDMGFSAPEIVSSTVRGWHHGRHRAMRSTRAREILTELMPALLAALAKTANPDQAFSRLDAFLERLPAGVQLFSLFHSNPSLLELVAEIMGGAPRLAAWLSRNPLLLDRVLEPSFYERLPDTRTMAAELSAKLDQARDMEDVLDLSRRWTNEAKFQVGAHILRNLADLDEAGRALSNIADTVIRTLLPRLEEEFVDRHGYCAGDGFGVVALGKLGGRELTATSDLDLVFLYDAPADAPQSDGARPLSLAHYYQRFGQRVIAALTALTGEGRLFDVDLRLRPSGNAGPLAVSLDAFTRYQSEEAWTWEHLALTRARVVEAAPPLADRIERAISHALCLERDPEELLLAVAEMRERIDREHHTENPWRVKHYRGGLIDCEFIAQYLELRHAHDHHDVLSASTVTAYERLAGRGLLSGDVATELIEATRFWRRLQGMLRLAFVGEATGETLPPALQRALAQAGGAVDFANLSAKVKEVAARTRAHFEAIIDIPAARIRGSADQPGEGLP
ncbi:MAG: glutamine-synthetase adenylyltransferase, partial [Alphaproteobacteria bacterium]